MEDSILKLDKNLDYFKKYYYILHKSNILRRNSYEYR